MTDRLCLLRHGDTAWTEQGRHTGVQEVALSNKGREQAQRAGRLLAGKSFARVLVSPQSRAIETCELAGFGEGARRCEDLIEWDYGEYEGLTERETHRRQPGWNLFCDGAPGGESPEQVAKRIQRVLAATQERSGECLLVGHGKLLRALAALWVERTIPFARTLPMGPAAIALLARDGSVPLLELWNYRGEL